MVCPKRSNADPIFSCIYFGKFAFFSYQGNEILLKTRTTSNSSINLENLVSGYLDRTFLASEVQSNKSRLIEYAYAWTIKLQVIKHAFHNKICDDVINFL